MLVNIIVDDEFKKLIPPLTAEERKGLEESILKEGCRDALILWGNTLIDGHNRYEICTKHNIPFKTIQKDFKSRDEVILYMIDTQFARRNLSSGNKILLAQAKKPILEKLAKKNLTLASGGDRKSENYKNQGLSEMIKVDYKKPEIIEPPKPVHVQKEVAKIAGVSTGTVAKFEQVQKKKPELVKAICDREISINEAYNKVKLEEKKETIRKAENKIAEQAKEEYKPTVIIGDSISIENDNKYDLLLTDPPYSTDVDNIDDFVNSWLYNALYKVKSTGFAYIFIGAYPEEVRAYLNAETPKHIKLCQQLIWTYKNTLGNNPKDRYKQNYQICLFYRGVDAPVLNCPLTNEQWAVQEINAPDGRQGDRYHAWQKPIEIAERFIRHSTTEGQTIYDPFCCTGTFLLAAAKLGRKAEGVEINKDNALIAKNRGCIIVE